MSTPTTADAYSMIHRAAALLMDPGCVYELRVPKAGREKTISGYFDDPLKLAECAAELDASEKYSGIYITLNPVNPALLSRCCNRARPYAEATTSDVDIVKRRWLLIDCDPKRPAGISSTRQEHGRAITTACGIWDDMHGVLGDPVVCDSGNGAHLLYPIDLPNDTATTAFVKKILTDVAAHCAPDDIAVDMSVFNAARITKIYGTMTRKGDSTRDRPHRRSCILEVPEIVCSRRESGETPMGEIR